MELISLRESRLEANLNPGNWAFLSGIPEHKIRSAENGDIELTKKEEITLRKKLVFIKIKKMKEKYMKDNYIEIINDVEVKGVTFDGKQINIANLKISDPIDLVPDPENPHDANAIKVMSKGAELGFLPRNLSAWLKANLIENVDGKIRCLGHNNDCYWMRVDVFMKATAEKSVLRNPNLAADKLML